MSEIVGNIIYDVLIVEVGLGSLNTSIFENIIDVDFQEFAVIEEYITRFQLGDSEYAMYEAIDIDTIHDSYDKQAILDADGIAIIWPIN